MNLILPPNKALDGKPFKIVKPKTLVKLVPKSAPDVHDKNLRPICL